MATPQRVLQIAANEIGYYAPDDPEPGSKYGRWMADVTGEAWLRGPSKDVWWCAIFVSWCYAMAGGQMPGLPSYNCDNFKHNARDYVLGSKYDAQPGDIVLFDWHNDGKCDHIGFVELNKGGYIQTIEGNTSGSAGGRQSNGNGVWRRTRDWSVVNCIIRPIYLGDDDMPLTDDDIARIWAFAHGNDGLNQYDRIIDLQGKAASTQALVESLSGKANVNVPATVIGGKTHRLVCNGSHRWESDSATIDELLANGWQDEGVVWEMPEQRLVYEWTNGNDTLLTAQPPEQVNAKASGYVCMGAQFPYKDSGTPVRRIFNGSVHHYTTSDNEASDLIAAGWTDEGIAFYV